MKNIDWNKAPSGATHHNSVCVYPWLRSVPASYYNGECWVEYTSNDTYWIDHFFKAVERPQEMKNKEWSGEGTPPIGTVCEYYWTEGDEWRKCEVVAYHNSNTVAVDVFEGYAVCLHHSLGLFRPIKTPEQIAEEEKSKAIDEMNDLILGWGVEKRMLAVLYDAGYRKQKGDV